MIELRHLVHVYAVAELRSFGRAAEAVHLSQPALTRSVQTAERLLGVRLFDRSRSGVELTAFGQLVVDAARPVIGAVRDLEREIELRKGLASGSLAITLAPYPSALSGQRAVARLLREHPGISCRVQTGGWARATQDVLDGAVDLAIADVGEAAADSRLQIEPLCTRPVWFVCRTGHALLGQREAGLDELSEYPWAGTRVPARMRPFLPVSGRCGRWDEHSENFVPAIETDTMTEIAVLARESDALVAATLTMVAADLEAGRVAVLPYAAPWFRLNYGVIVRRGRTLTPAADEFIRIVREIEAGLEAAEAALRARFATC